MSWLIISKTNQVRLSSGISLIKNPADLALLDASVMNPSILIESDEMFWMFMDKHNEVQNYDGNAWPLPKDAFAHPRSNVRLPKYYALI